MNRTFATVLSVGAIAAIGASATPAQAQTQRTGCRVVAVRPYVDAHGKIHAAGSRAGCTTTALFRVRLWKAATGPDHVIKSGAKVIRNARVTLTPSCAAGTYYTTVTDYRGHTSRSKAIRLTCPPAAPAGSTAVGTALENEVVRLTNVERAKAGCGPLRHDARLRAAAYDHSAEMSANDDFDHTSPDGRQVGDRITAAGYTWTALAENIAKGAPTAQAVVQGWMNSPGHRANILNCAYADIGVGYVAAGGPYWTQDFGKH